MIVSFDPNTSDFGQHGDLPIFIANALELLAQQPPQTLGAWQTDDTLALGEAHQQDRIVSPADDSFSAGASLNAAGQWRLQTSDGKTTAVLQVNLADAAESELQPRDGTRNQRWPHVAWLPDLGPLWMPLVALALVWMAGHWAFYQRRTID